LSEANLHPDWVAGISIGAINAALIAGNAPELRIPMKSAMHSNLKPATDSDLKPAGLAI
jgi:predicted acylesterase/phospholipase RssA